jgi:hypothetical protein
MMQKLIGWLRGWGIRRELVVEAETERENGRDLPDESELEGWDAEWIDLGGES